MVFADLLVWGLTTDQPMPSTEVVVDRPVLQCVDHLASIFVCMPLGRVFLDQAVESLNKAIGLGCIGPCSTVIYANGSTEVAEWMRALCATAAPVSVLGVSELASIVRQDRVDLERVERQAPAQEVYSNFLCPAIVDAQEDKSSRSINGDIAVSLKRVYFRQVERVNVQETGLVVFEPARWLLSLVMESADSIASQKSMDACSGGSRHNRLYGVHNVV